MKICFLKKKKKKIRFSLVKKKIFKILQDNEQMTPNKCCVLYDINRSPLYYFKCNCNSFIELVTGILNKFNYISIINLTKLFYVSSIEYLIDNTKIT